MSFSPEKITKQHVLDAVKLIENKKIELEPSTRFDVIINGKAYPPKEIMRYAHERMNGEHIWKRNGGIATNKYLEALGFEIKSKFEPIALTNIDTIWKLGCNWDKGNPSFYEFIKAKDIVIGVEDKRYSVGDLILVTEGFTAMSIAQITEPPSLVTKKTEFKGEFDKLEIPFESWINFSPVEWYELEENERFIYPLVQGIRRVQDTSVKQRVLDLWNARNSNYWIFQANPNSFDFETAIRDNLIEEWTVSAHKDKIKVGDKVIIWITGKNAGCYALAEVTTEPKIVSNSKDSHLWKTEDKNSTKAGVKITHSLIDTPLLWSNLKNTQGLENLKVGNQGTNFAASKKEYKIIHDLIGASIEPQNMPQIHAKNIILYGPPGTGKTYNSIDKAVEIATPARAVLNNHGANKIVFDELRKSGQIEFVTFHQNYSYEDFVVGLKPDLDESSILKFKRSEGIFYKISKRAENNFFESQKSDHQLSSFEDVFEDFLRPLQEEGKEIEIKMASGKASFWITDINPSNLGFRKQSGGTDHTLSLDTIEELYYGKRNFTSGLRYYYQPLLTKLWELGKANPTKKTGVKNFVLIIDEINRANISKVFGELITLLEDDKRLGEENELRVSLPNGEKDFGIPPNLYVIGTMNTADKSIALVDIALRRRFEFVGFYPQYEGYDIEAISLLQKLNEAIFKEKKSADYLIGHGYFMKSESIKLILENKIIPLLMEYFSGKTDIVTRIFVNTGWNVIYNSTTYSWDITKN